MNTVKPVLVLGAEPRVAVTIARSLHRRGIPVHVARLGGEGEIVSKSVSHTLRLPSDPVMAREPLLKAIRQQGYSYLMPTSDTALAILLDAYEEFSTLVQLACPSPDRVRQVLDKDVTLKLASELGIPVPESRIDAIDGPMVVKPRDKSLQHHFKVRYFSSARSYQDAVTADPSLGEGVTVQAFSPGDGVGVEVLMHQGECLCAFQHRRLKQLPWSGGVGVVAVSEALHPALYRYAVMLLKALDWQGVAMVEFRHDPVTGQATLLEVNGRYFGSLSLSYLAGVDFPYHDWQRSHGQVPQPSDNYRQGLRWRWSAGVLYRMEGLRSPGPPWLDRPSIPGELLGLVRDFLPPTRDALWSWSDPGPAAREWSHAVIDLSRRLVRSAVKVLFPARIVESIQYWRHMDPTVRRPLISLRLRRALGIARMTRRALPDEIRSILFICHGNIIRSAYSEVWLRQRFGGQLAGLHIRSAGLRARNGKPADPRAVIAAGENDVDLSGHSAQALTEELIDTSDLIVVMDYLNEANLIARFPRCSSRVRLIAECGGGTLADEVRDPYTGQLEGVRRTYRKLDVYLTKLAEHLVASQGKGR